MAGLKLVTPPGDWPVSLEDVKDFCRVESTHKDTLLTALLQGAVAHYDGPKGFLGRALIDQTWDYYLDAFPTGAIELPLPPLIEVIGVFYTDSADAEQEMTSGFTVDTGGDPGRVFLSTSGASWPTTGTVSNAVRIRFRAGYLDTNSPPAADVPEDVKTAIKMRVLADYDIGTDMDRFRAIADEIARPKRFYLGFA